jgi:hypothetical protein
MISHDEHLLDDKNNTSVGSDRSVTILLFDLLTSAILDFCLGEYEMWGWRGFGVRGKLLKKIASNLFCNTKSLLFGIYILKPG